MDERLFQDEQGWWITLRGGDNAGPYPDRASATVALERWRRRWNGRFELRPALSDLAAQWRNRRSA